MSIELVYGFVESDKSSYINEEELLIDHGINLYSLEIIDGYATKPCYGVPCVLADNIKFGSDILSLCQNVKDLLRDEDVQAVHNLHKIYCLKSNTNSNPVIGLNVVYSTPLGFKSEPYSLRVQDLNTDLKSEPNPLGKKYSDSFEDIYAQARTHIEEQVNAHARIQEYLQSLQSESTYKFKLTHNLPPKDFLSSGQITIKYVLEIFKENKLVHHVKIRSSGTYTLADGYNGTTDQIIVVLNDNFEPDEDFFGEFESWVYLQADGTNFQELVSPLTEYLESLV
jgi:hypothetical protein